MRQIMARLSGAGLLLLTCLYSGSTPWPHFRGGPNLDGVSLETLGGRPTKKWTLALGRRLLSSPVGDRGTIYIGATDGFFRGVDLATGAVKWAFDTGHAIEAPAFIQGDTVLVANGKGRVFALSTVDGKPRWSTTLDGPVMGSANGPRTGPDNWWAIGCYDHRLYMLDNLGKIKWFFETEEYVHGSPAFDRGRLLCAGCDGYLRWFDQSGTSLGKISLNSYIAASPAVRGDTAYVGTYGGELHAIDLIKSQAVWKVSNASGAGYFSSPTLGLRSLYVGCRDNQVYAHDLLSGKLLWAAPTPGGVDASPVLCGPRLLVASLEGIVSCLDTKTGLEIWSYELGTRISGTPMVLGGLVIVATEQGTLWCLGPKK